MSERERVEITVAVWTDKQVTDSDLVAVQWAAHDEARRRGLRVTSSGVGIVRVSDDFRALMERGPTQEEA